MHEEARQEALRAYQEILSTPAAQGEATQAYKDRDKLAYEISRLPLGTPRKLSIICVGAGFSGLALAHEVASGQLQNVQLTVYEKNSAVGGTWFENRYPGYIKTPQLLPFYFSKGRM
jgi:hypothetical protein